MTPEVGLGARLGEVLRQRDYATHAIDPAATDPFVRLLLHGRSVAAASLEPTDVEALVSAGAVERQGDQLSPQFRVAPWNDLLVAHDPDRPAELVPETVLGVNNTTRTLAHLTPRRRVGRALDVATGSGGPALLLTEHADTVIATDLSERAIGYAVFNATMNERPLEARVGSLFEPVEDDEPFDLITANLPFVVSPDSTFVFRDGGMTGDDLCRAAVSGASRHLGPTGTAVLLCSWLVPADTPPTDRVRDWLGEHDGAALVVHHSTVDPEAYARRWNEYLLVQDPAAYAPTIARWVEAHERWGAAGVATGAVVLRRGTSRWIQATTMTGVPQGDGGRQLERIIFNVERLQSAFAAGDPVSLLDARLALVTSHRLEQAMRYAGTWQVDDVRLILDDSAGITGDVEPLAVHVLLRLDGEQRLGALIDSVADEFGIDAETLRAATESSCRSLLEAGCLDWTT